METKCCNTNSEANSSDKDDETKKIMENFIYDTLQNVALITNLIADSMRNFNEIKEKYAEELEDEIDPME